MKINELVLFNFRLFEYSLFQFNDGLNIITGANGQGKTSILEALALFALGKSVRAKQDIDLIRFGQTAAQLRINIKDNEHLEQLAIKITDKGKQIAINQIRKSNITDLIGRFHMVLFTPDDLEIIKGGPDERRKFMNQYLVQLSSNYIIELRTYQRLLNQRNLLLKQRQYNTIPTWDESLSKSGAKIIHERLFFSSQINLSAGKRYQQLTNGDDYLEIKYRPSVQGQSQADITNELVEGLKKNLAKDKEKGFTSIGPHRDDISINIAGKPASRFASQGQIRSAILAIKIALMDYFKEIIGEYPVMLLDDVFSELDEFRQSSLIDMIKNTQTIMTIAQLNSLKGNELDTSKIFEVAHGIIKSER